MEEGFVKHTLDEVTAKQFINIYDQTLSQNIDRDKGNKRSSEICDELNAALTQKQRANLIVRLMEFVHINLSNDEDELKTLEQVGAALKISLDEYAALQSLVRSSADSISESQLIISAEDYNATNKTNHLHRSHLQGTIQIVYVASAGLYFAKYLGTQELQLNGNPMKSGSIYIFGTGAIIRAQLIQTIYYSEVVNCFVNQKIQSVEFRAEGITYHFSEGKIGLHELSFCESSGSLVAIMGGSGAGKSTLLNVLNGNTRPSNGKVLINGINLHDQGKELEGVVGFVSQDDLLIEDLTVYQNLFFNAQLCFAGKTNDFIRERVERISHELGLSEISHLKVGSPLEKTISGGQRKRLNIALELIREPAVLFLDEPTSGLSSRDSEITIDLLKSLSLKGTLVFVVIHQPSSQIFKVFDKLLLLDQGGYPVYFGNPVDAVLYFKQATHQINPDVGECVCCGNVNPEQIFSIMEARHLNDDGFPTGERRISAKQWNDYYKDHIASPLPPKGTQLDGYKNQYRKPGLVRQFNVFVKRDVLSKLNNKQYMIITLLEAPVLAFLLAFLTRYQIPGKAYAFGDNRNLVAYVFMSVIVSLFLGLMVSAEEILRDRKIRQRERFLNLSKAAYTKSKIFILMVISAVQSFLFVFIGNSIMGFQELYFEYWLMLFTVSLFANALGLNVSSAFKSAVTIYILIPFLIIPQLMLSGLLVKYNELHPSLAARSVVPLSGEIMPTRWAFEGLTVQLFKSNSYEEKVFELEQKKAALSYRKVNWYDAMKTAIASASEENSDSTLSLIKTEFEKAGIDEKYSTAEAIKNGESRKQLDAMRRSYFAEYSQVGEALDELFSKDGGTGNAHAYWGELRKSYFNDRIADLVRNQDVVSDQIYEEFGELHPGQNSIFFDGSNTRQIRSHFYAPKKHFFGKYYDTFYVNLLVILGMTIILYIALYLELLERAVKYLERLKMKTTR